MKIIIKIITSISKLFIFDYLNKQLLLFINL